MNKNISKYESSTQNRRFLAFIIGLLFLQYPLLSYAAEQKLQPKPTPQPSSQLNFKLVTNEILEGTCISPNPFGFTFTEWNGLYFFTFSHSRKNHCAWKWNGRKFMHDKVLSAEISRGEMGSWSVESADIDGDGDMDLFGRSSDAPKGDGWWRNKNGHAQVVRWPYGRYDYLFWFDENGNGKLDPHSRKNDGVRYMFDYRNIGKIEDERTIHGCAPPLMKFIDIEPDGDTDAICFDYKEDKVTVFLNEKGVMKETLGTNYGLTYRAPEGTGNKASHIVADLNNDGCSDILIGDITRPSFLYVNRCDGNGNFETKQFPNDVSSVKHSSKNMIGRPTIAVWDYDNDCDLDVATLSNENTSSSKSTAAIYENKSGGNCIRVSAKPGDRVSAYHNGSLIFSHEYILFNMHSQPFGYVHVGIGKLDPNDVKIEVK